MSSADDRLAASVANGAANVIGNRLLVVRFLPLAHRLVGAYRRACDEESSKKLLAKQQAPRGRNA